MVSKAEAEIVTLQVGQKAAKGQAVSIARGGLKALEGLRMAQDYPDFIPGVSTGIRGIDQALRGLQRGDVTLIAARPSMGKSALATSIALNVGLRGEPVAVFSLEMSEDQLAVRMHSDLILRAGRTLPYHDALSGQIGRSGVRFYEQAQQMLEGLPILVDDTAARTMAAIRTGVRTAMRRHPKLELVIIDHLNLVRHDRPDAPRVLQLGEITQAAKAMGKDLGVAVALLHQVNRSVESREDRRPNLGDLRASGEIEENVDTVAFLYREAYYAGRAAETARHSNPDNQADAHARFVQVKHDAEFIIPKNRMGPIKTVDLWCDISVSAFRDPADAGQQQITFEDLHG
jgi:replicative DNA helicase